MVFCFWAPKEKYGKYMVRFFNLKRISQISYFANGTNGIDLKRYINFIDFATMEIRVEYEEMFEP